MSIKIDKHLKNLYTKSDKNLWKRKKEMIAIAGQEIKELDEFIYLGGSMTRTWKSDSQKLWVYLPD